MSEKIIQVLGSETTQPWSNAKGVTEILRAVGRPWKTHVFLKKEGALPFLVSWQTLISGPAKAHRANYQGWEKELKFTQLLKGVYYEGNGRTLFCPADGPGWVYTYARNVIGLERIGGPFYPSPSDQL